MQHRISPFARVVTIVALLLFLTGAALAQYRQPRITQRIDENTSVRLAGNTRSEAMNPSLVRGAAPDSLPIEHILLFLQRSPQQEQALDAYIEELNDPQSPNFHKWMTPEQFGEYGVDDGDIQQVTNWLESQGFTVNRVYNNKILIDFSGTAGDVNRAFHTQMVNLEVKGEKHLANASDPQIPAALAPVIRGIFSLHDFRPHAMHKSVSQYTFSGCAASSSHPTEPGTCYELTPQDNQTIYNLTPLYQAGYSGQGQTIAVVEDTNAYGTDFATYRSTFGLSTAYPLGNLVTVHPGGCTNPGTNADDGEANIDVEVASAIAPSATIELESCPSGTVTFGGLIALQNRLNGSAPYPGVVSVSYGVCEAANGDGGNAAFSNTYQQAAAYGVSVFGASGDEGPSSCSVDFTNTGYDVTSLGISGWTSTAWNVSVGGTDFEDTYNTKYGYPSNTPLSTYWNATNTSGYGSAKSYIPEIPWNDACASTLIAEYARGSFNTYGASGTGMCNTSPYSTTSGYLISAAASGGASNCYSGSGGANTTSALITEPNCQGLAKPAWQSAYGVPYDGVRDIPDVSMFASNGLWGHYEVVCWSDPAYTSSGSAVCTGAPSTWSGFGGTSVSSPTMAAIQALVNQRTGTTWGLPLSYYYQMGQAEYGTQGGTFNGSACNSSASGGPASTCVFNDVTQGDIDVACRYNGTAEEAHCYKPSTNGVDSTDNVTAATVINGGSGYTSAPTCTIAGPTNNQPYKTPTGTTLWAGGTQATCTAAVNTGSTTAVWTVVIASASSAGFQIVLTNNAGATICGPYTLAGSSTTTIATALTTSLGACSTYVTATRSSATVTITSKTGGYAGNFNVGFGANGDIFEEAYVTITNTTKGQGPNYVSGITIGTAGTGYQPDTPITLTGVGSGAIAVANTTPATPSQSYQPAYGAAPGYDLATGLGSPNACNFVTSSVWGAYTPAAQTITFPNPGPVTYGVSPITLTATATSGLAVTYQVISGPGTVNGSTLTVTGAGTIVVEADQAGNCVTAAATPVQDSIVVNPASQSITVTIPAPASKAYGGQFTVAATATSGLPVSYSSAGGCTNSGATFTMTSGTDACTVYFDQAGNANYNAATEVTETVTATKASQTITVTIPAPASAAYGSQFTVAATASSGLTVTYGSAGGCSNSGATYTMTSGTTACTVKFDQAGNGNYNAATEVTESVAATKVTLTVTADNKSMNVGSPVPTLTASYSGFIPGDTSAVLTGSPALSTTATNNSLPGPYPITVTQGTLASANYSFAFVNGTMTVNQVVGTVQITATSTLTKNGDGSYAATITLKNTGTGTALNVVLTTATLGTPSGTPLPQSAGSIAPGGSSAPLYLTFPLTAGSSGAAVVEKLGGTYTGGSFTLSTRVTLPAAP